MNKVILLIVCVFLVGCSSNNTDESISEPIIQETMQMDVGAKNSKEEVKQQVEKTPEKIVKEVFDAMKKTDMEKLSEILTGETSSEIMEGDAFLELVKVSNKTLKYNIQDSVITGNNAIVTVECTYGDVKAIFGTAFMEYFKKAMEVAFSGVEATQEEMDKMLADSMINALETMTPEEYITTIQVPCIKMNNKWAIDNSTENIELSDVMTGNLVSALQEMSESMNSQQ